MKRSPPPDVPADRLRSSSKRRGESYPAYKPSKGVAARAAARKEIHFVAADPRGACQQCGGPDRPLASFTPIVDRSNGQRITIALCLACVSYGRGLLWGK